MKFIKVESPQPDIKVVSLNRPEVKNAFHPEMIAEITNFFQQESQTKTSKLLILKGEGTAFCAGADLNWMKSMVNYSYEENIEDSKKLWGMFAAVQNCEVPVVAVAHGAVFGGALGLLACADYVYADEATQFCFSEVKLGLAPAVITGFITRKIPDAFCRPLMISGEVFNANEARRIGLVHQTFTGTTVDVTEIVKTFAGNGTEAMREAKKLLNVLLETNSFDEAQAHCTRVIAERRISAEGQEKLQKFLNRTSK
ncbi:enoyl-CoA hydratase-related protein [Pseudobdellovibrio exovorus]|uniref:Enoyl-CoA hydratase/isomerase family protein n=1 Tax=Pseudobdellovibrio exovorus JSS TaxID=1184267 RepID=M4VTI0_9BACT|nr:enoyl-CoA hydratase-related protein [Pseudobdellovibrio exovorus]AGH96489.1 enoyl-CoA hydratase/isomerase family protein [Pseudobdellovibrio exovorus JSS]